MQAEQKEAELIQLYRDAFPDAARVVKRLGGDLEKAKDLFQEALLIYIEKSNKGELRLTYSAKAYLIGIIKMLWLQQQRKSPSTVSIDNLYALPETTADANEWEEQALNGLQRVGQRCLHLLKAFYWDGASMGELAQRFGLKGERSATVQKFKCLEKVRAWVKKEAYATRVN